eukprot:Pompholyxophrys_punicea_v1_NODE_1400_length_737_cov_1.199413.p1 type:complete len:128 gc:universal NODE_1400_length_737_cov_1.199413:641-258(-)
MFACDHLITVLAKQGLAVRGRDTQGNFEELMCLRAQDLPNLNLWFARSTTWMPHDIQDEIFKIVAQEIQRKLVQRIQENGKFCLIVDETIDVSYRASVDLCCTVGADLIPEEYFLALYKRRPQTAKL